MTIEELICYGKKYVHKTQAEMLLATLLNVNSLELLLKLDEQVDSKIVADYKKKIMLLQENKPIQYVIGNVNFYGNIFEVNENVLIPRFETEELVENTIKFINKYFPYPIDIIDLGTGSGAIGLTLKKKLNQVNVTLLDGIVKLPFVTETSSVVHPEKEYPANVTSFSTPTLVPLP